MSMEHWWNDIVREQTKYSETKLSQCQFVHHKSHLGLRGEMPGLQKSCSTEDNGISSRNEFASRHDSNVECLVTVVPHSH
jgi:hypothetical protein